jgi:ABC-type branched-subunit amino acid transport system permease subunit
MAGPFSKRELFFIALAALIGLVVLPCLNAFVPDGSWFHVTDLSLNRYGKYLTYAVLALGVNLLWGYTGLLSLGQCLFFSLGGYAFGMYLMMNISRLGQYHEAVPDFMVFLEYQTKYAATGGFPSHWIPFKHLWFALAAMVLVPAILAYVFGFLAFRSRIKGVYFSILSQALTYAACLMFFRNDFTFGGNNGLTDFKFMLGTPSLEAGEIKDPVAFANQLRTGTNGVEKYLWSQFAPTNQARVSELATAGKAVEVEQVVTDELNRTMATSPIYSEQRFAGISLSDSAKVGIAETPRDADLLKLNRQLLEEAFPGTVAHKGFTGYVINDPSTKRALYIASGVLLLLTYLFCRWLTSTRFGLIQRAVRDSENRVLFSGYATADFKLFVFVIAAVIAALGGALSVPQIGGINPSEMSPEKSIEAVIWVSVGGRGNLLGPILGAIGINSLKSYATHNFAEQWPYILGGLFVFVTLFMPKGIIGLPGQLRAIAKKLSKKPTTPPSATPKPELETSTKE